MMQYFNVVYMLLCAILLFGNSCETSHKKKLSDTIVINDNSSSKLYKILPLGDSRVEGATVNSISYRYDLWKLLVASKWNFDFVGTQFDNSSYPTLLGNYFDPDHQGIGGFKTHNVLNSIPNILKKTGDLDIVLLGIGGNDLVAGIPVTAAIKNINQAIDLLQDSNPNIMVFIERIAPGRSNVMTPEALIVYNNFNEQIHILAQDQTNTNSKIVVVDMSENWSDNYMADNLHYNNLGAKEVANRYFEAITNTLKK